QSEGSLLRTSDLGLRTAAAGDSKEFLSKDFLARIHPEDREAVMKNVRRALQEGGDFHAEFRLIENEKEEGRSEMELVPPSPLTLPTSLGPRWIASVGAVARNETNEPARLVGVYYDVTARKH